MGRSTRALLISFLGLSRGFQNHNHHGLPGYLRAKTLLGSKPFEVKESEFLREGMEFRRLGSSDLIVSKACVGTMMFGDQVDEATAVGILDAAFDDFSVNFIVHTTPCLPRLPVQANTVSFAQETSELYPMPADRSTHGAADRIVGKWLEGRAREDVVLASNVAGSGAGIDWLRKDGQRPRATKAQIIESVEASLERLGTDYIDLIQIGWPDRYSPSAGSDFFNVEEASEDADLYSEQLEAIRDLVDQGKVRAVGLSNETPYGLMRFLEAAKARDLPVVASVQHAYNLLERNALETSMLEACTYSNTGILAHSPLAGGALTGKYAKKEATEENRLKLFPGYTARYLLPSAEAAVIAYADVAENYGLTPAQLALSWCYSRPFIASTVIGATSVEQIRENLMALNCPLTEEMEQDIFELYCNDHRDPTIGIVEV